jgi:hypothetical protein
MSWTNILRPREGQVAGWFVGGWFSSGWFASVVGALWTHRNRES